MVMAPITRLGELSGISSMDRGARAGSTILKRSSWRASGMLTISLVWTVQPTIPSPTRNRAIRFTWSE